MSDARQAILAATEELLGERPLSDLSVADILERAGVSRTTFYTHFTSKTDPVAACFRLFMDDVLVAVDPFLAGTSADPEAAVRHSLRGWVALCAEHRGLLRAVSEEWPHDDELRRLWWGRLERGARDIAATLEAARAAGSAPAGADAEALGTVLVWAFERVVHVALAGGAQGLPDPQAAVEPLVQLTVGGLYGRPLASPAPSTRGAATGRP